MNLLNMILSKLYGWKRLFLIWWLCCISFSATAQLQDVKHNFAIGGNVGLNFSSMDFNPRVKQFTLMSKSFGFTSRYISEKYFKALCGAQIEVNFSERGWKENIDDGSNDTYYRRMKYVEVPFLMHIAFGKEYGFGGRFFINAGPQVSYFLSDAEVKSETWDTSNRPSGVTAQYDTPVAHKFEYGIVGGLGAELRTKAGNFLVEGRYYFGLSDVFGNTKKDYFGRSANMYMGARIAYLIDLIK